MGVEQGVGDFRALLQAAADGGGNRLAGLAAEPRLLRSACGCRACCAPRRRPGDPQADAQLFLHAPQQVFQVLPAAQGFQCERPGAALPGGSGGGCDGPRRAPPCARVRRRRRRAGRAGGGAGKRSWHHHSQGPASRAATLRRPRERASALQRHLALLLQAAEDGVGDLHPLGIGIVAVGRITRPRSRPGTNAT